MEKLKELRLEILQMLEDIESKTNNRYMSNLENCRYYTLLDVLGMIEDMIYEM